MRVFDPAAAVLLPGEETLDEAEKTPPPSRSSPSCVRPTLCWTAARFLHKLGEKDEASPLVATHAHFVVETRGKDHPEDEELRQQSAGMLVACAAGRRIEPDKALEWFKSEGLDDPDRFLPALEKALEQVVGDNEWVFDRSVVGKA